MDRTSGSRRVLVVEDEAMLASIMAEVLEDAGYEIVGPVRSLREAMRAVAHDEFDAALMDVHLEGELSLSLATLLAQRGIPVLLVTGHADPRDAGDLCRSSFLAKPFNDSQLVERMRALFQTQPDPT